MAFGHLCITRHIDHRMRSGMGICHCNVAGFHRDKFWPPRIGIHSNRGVLVWPDVLKSRVVLSRLVGATRFELATPCTPCKCATRLRHAPTEKRMIAEKARGNLSAAPLAAKNLDQLFELEPHLMDELLALIQIHLRLAAREPIAGSTNRKTLFIQ